MDLRRQLVIVGSVFIAAVLIQCSNGTGSGNGDNSSPNMNMRKMDMGGANLTAILPQEEDDPVSFANDIQPIFDLRCTVCHNPVLLRGGMDLTPGNAYDNLVNHAVSTPCRNDLGHDAVRVQTCDTPPCDPSQSMLWSKTLPDARAPVGTRCLQPMPFNTQGLGEICGWEFHKIEQWLMDGAPNN